MQDTAATTGSTIDQLVEDFALLDDWELRYRYVIELGQGLAPFPDELRTDANKVRGCASQVWLASGVERGEGADRMVFTGDSDAHIVRGLIAILFALYSGKSAREILATDGEAVFARLGLVEHLHPQRANGLAAMNARIRAEAKARAAQAATA